MNLWHGSRPGVSSILRSHLCASSSSFLILFLLPSLFLQSVNPSPVNAFNEPEILNPSELESNIRQRRDTSIEEAAETSAPAPGLSSFLSQFVLIKTPQGYVLGRSQRADPQLRERRFRGVNEGNFQLRVRKKNSNPFSSERNFQLRVRRPFPTAENNFQLRVRKAYPSSEQNFQLRVRKPFPTAENNFQLRVRKRGIPQGAERNFQLRVRKSVGDNFQLRVRKPFPTAENNFQLRVRKAYPTAENNFQLRVRKPFPSESNFQLRVRKPYPSAENNFQLRIRKGFPSAENNFQLRVRKSSPSVRESGPEAVKELLQRYHLVKVPGVGYALGDTFQNWESENGYSPEEVSMEEAAEREQALEMLNATRNFEEGGEEGSEEEEEEEI